MTSLVQGAYWLLNGTDKCLTAVAAPDKPLHIETLDKYEARKTLFDYCQIWLAEILSDGSTFVFRNAQHGRVLDDQGGSVAIADCTGSLAQQWKVELLRVTQASPSIYKGPRYRIRNCSTANSLDDKATSAPDFRPEQRWFFQPASLPTVYRISNVFNGLYLEPLKGQGTSFNPKLQSIHLSMDQFWLLEYHADNDSYVIRNVGAPTTVLGYREDTINPGNPIYACPISMMKRYHWKIDDSVGTKEDPQSTIVSVQRSLAVAATIEDGLEAANISSGDSEQLWRFELYPQPSLFWTTVQVSQGVFLSQNDADITQVIPSFGSRHASDYISHWRFVPGDKRPFHHNTIINRATGSILASGRDLPIYATSSPRDDSCFWAIDASGDGVGIINTSTRVALEYSEGYGICGAISQRGANNGLRSWIPLTISDSLPSFAIVNVSTGRFLSFITPYAIGSVLTVEDDLHDFRNPWFFENSAPGDKSGEFTIINKASGMVLDHYLGQRLEAYTGDMVTDPHHQWKVIPCNCGLPYFEIVNVATGQYLEERSRGRPNVNATLSMDLSRDDRSQLWDLVSFRNGRFDLRVWDDDVLSVFLPSLQPNDATELEHRIQKRAAGREKKGKKGTTGTPLIRRITEPVMRAIFLGLIDQWIDSNLSSNTQAGTRVSARRQEVEQWGIHVPRLLQDGGDQAGWVRIDIQGTYTTPSGQRVANIQGQWNTLTVFHVIVPIRVNVGVEVIRQAMRQSLETATTIDLTATVTGSDGGPLPSTKPPPPGSSGGSGHGWLAVIGTLLAAGAVSRLQN